MALHMKKLFESGPDILQFRVNENIFINRDNDWWDIQYIWLVMYVECTLLFSSLSSNNFEHIGWKVELLSVGALMIEYL